MSSRAEMMAEYEKKLNASSGGNQAMADAEKAIKRNPHPDFKKVEASRPDWDDSLDWKFTKTRDPNWKLGGGANDAGKSLEKNHVEIDPYEEGRPATFNYKLLISAITPRPIGFLSTRSKDGESTNLAPFSYFNLVNHDPPIFIIGFAGGMERAKDSLKNVIDTQEVCINIISEHYVEAANACSVNAPYGTSEWALTGLTPAPCTHIKASRVKEAVFSIEAKLYKTEEFESRTTPGKKTGVLAILEGVKFWAREDAINEDHNLMDPNVLRPISRLGGITYGRTLEGLEIPRPDFDEMMADGDNKKFAQPKATGQ